MKFETPCSSESLVITTLYGFISNMTSMEWIATYKLQWKLWFAVFYWRAARFSFTQLVVCWVTYWHVRPSKVDDRVAKKASWNVYSCDWCTCVLLLTHMHIGSDEIRVNYYHESSINPAMADEVVISTEFHKVTFLNLKICIRRELKFLGYYAASSGNLYPTLRGNLSFYVQGSRIFFIIIY